MKSFILFVSFLLSFVVHAEVKNESAGIKALIQEDQGHLEKFYYDLHENPELSGEETRTAGKVAEEMRRLGLEVTEGIGKTGVVGVLRNGSGPTTLIRTELDALPVPEDTHVAYESKNPGKMHACGHDFHAAALMGAAYVMSHSKDQWKGTLIFLAQPAEESGNGALAMIKDGLYKKIPKPDQLLALHTSGMYKRGVIGITSGFALANVDTVHVTLKGRGTHGSKPDMGIDPFIEMAEFILKLQTIVGREKDASKPGVISVGAVHGGAKANIIPDEVKLMLTVRSYDSNVRELLKRRIKEVAFGIAKTSGAPDPEVTYPEESNATYNDPKLSSHVKDVLIQKLGSNSVIDTAPIMGGEDFGELGIAVNSPSLIFWVGERNEKDPKTSNHSPRFLPDYKGTSPLAIEAMSFALLDLHKK